MLKFAACMNISAKMKKNQVWHKTCGFILVLTTAICAQRRTLPKAKQTFMNMLQKRRLYNFCSCK